ncbi:hypothetical protein ACA910_010406 [Epithemia clementina (nom. ined.)]
MSRSHNHGYSLDQKDLSFDDDDDDDDYNINNWQEAKQQQPQVPNNYDTEEYKNHPNGKGKKEWLTFDQTGTAGKNQGSPCRGQDPNLAGSSSSSSHSSGSWENVRMEEQLRLAQEDAPVVPASLSYPASTSRMGGLQSPSQVATKGEEHDDEDEDYDDFESSSGCSKFSLVSTVHSQPHTSRSRSILRDDDDEEEEEEEKYKPHKLQQKKKQDCPDAWSVLLASLSVDHTCRSSSSSSSRNHDPVARMVATRQVQQRPQQPPEPQPQEPKGHYNYSRNHYGVNVLRLTQNNQSQNDEELQEVGEGEDEEAEAISHCCEQAAKEQESAQNIMATKSPKNISSDLDLGYQLALFLQQHEQEEYEARRAAAGASSTTSRCTTVGWEEEPTKTAAASSPPSDPPRPRPPRPRCVHHPSWWRMTQRTTPSLVRVPAFNLSQSVAKFANNAVPHTTKTRGGGYGRDEAPRLPVRTKDKDRHDGGGGAHKNTNK